MIVIQYKIIHYDAVQTNKFDDMLWKLFVRYYHSQVCCIKLDDDTHQLLPYTVPLSTDHRRENSKYGRRVVKEYNKKVKE